MFSNSFYFNLPMYRQIIFYLSYYFFFEYIFRIQHAMYERHPKPKPKPNWNFILNSKGKTYCFFGYEWMNEGVMGWDHILWERDLFLSEHVPNHVRNLDIESYKLSSIMGELGNTNFFDSQYGILDEGNFGLFFLLTNTYLIPLSSFIQ